MARNDLYGAGRALRDRINQYSIDCRHTRDESSDESEDGGDFSDEESGIEGSPAGAGQRNTRRGKAPGSQPRKKRQKRSQAKGPTSRGARGIEDEDELAPEEMRDPPEGNPEEAPSSTTRAFHWTPNMQPPYNAPFAPFGPVGSPERLRDMSITALFIEMTSEALEVWINCTNYWARKNFRNWKELDFDEALLFIAHLVAMTRAVRHGIRSYWSNSDPLLRLPFFGM